MFTANWSRAVDILKVSYFSIAEIGAFDVQQGISWVFLTVNECMGFLKCHVLKWARQKWHKSKQFVYWRGGWQCIVHTGQSVLTYCWVQCGFGSHWNSDRSLSQQVHLQCVEISQSAFSLATSGLLVHLVEDAEHLFENADCNVDFGYSYNCASFWFFYLSWFKDLLGKWIECLLVKMFHGIIIVDEWRWCWNLKEYMGCFSFE